MAALAPDQSQLESPAISRYPD